MANATPPDGEERREDGGEAPRRESFSEVVTRAARNAATSSTFKPGKDHVLARGFRASVSKPWRELTDMISGVSADVRSAAANARNLGHDIDHQLRALTDDEREGYRQKMQWSWLAYQLGLPMSFLCVAYSTTQSGISSLSALLSGAMIMVYAIIATLRVCRDVASVRQGRQISFREVIDKIDTLWNPLDRSHLAYHIHRFVLMPSIAASLVVMVYAIISQR